jgi:hypothetical protein
LREGFYRGVAQHLASRQMLHSHCQRKLTAPKRELEENVATFPDVVVLLPGISGSALAKDGREIWGTSSGALWNAITSGDDTIRQFALGDDDPSVDDLHDGVAATRLFPDLHIIPGLWKIDGYSATTASLCKRFPYGLMRTISNFHTIGVGITVFLPAVHLSRGRSCLYSCKLF